MTTKQRIAILADWWPRACDVQGWRKEDRPKRLAVISQAVGREIQSLNDLDNAKDIDQVKAHLGLLAENLAAAAETTPAGYDFGYRRRLCYLINQHARTLAPTAPHVYLDRLARDKFHITPAWTTLEDLDTAQLHQLMITLNARRHAKTRAAKTTSAGPF